MRSHPSCLKGSMVLFIYEVMCSISSLAAGSLALQRCAAS